MSRRQLIALIFIIYALQPDGITIQPTAAVQIRFTNLICRTYDQSFSEFTYCLLKVMQRGVVSLNINLKIHQLPVNNFTMGFQLWKKGNTYHPFLYNMNMDYCAFMKNRRRWPVSKVFMDIIWKYCNFNHSCPYQHDIIVKDLVLREEQYRLLPLPSGDYMFHTRMSFYNRLEVLIRTFFTVQE